MMQTGVVVGVVVSSPPPCCSRSPGRRTNQEIFHIFEASFFTLIHSFIHHPQKYPDSSPVSPVFSAAKQWASVFIFMESILVASS